ncbi:MAG: TolC family protein, partial [Burkholderiales bacterium]|nr:TolC family protein [Burkholderiales bacterium]
VRAQDWPQLSLGALAGRARLQAGGSSSSGSIWSLAPSLSLPLFDGGQRAAAKQGAAARREEMAALLQQRWREAVGEVEDAMQRLHAAAERQQQAEASIDHWMRLVNSAQLLSQAGLQSGPQRAQTQRQALAGYSAAQAVRAEHALAWVQLYRTLGGGWTEADATP